MDALEFYSAQKRYCRGTRCRDCQIYGTCCAMSKEGMTSFVNFIEEWAKKNPVKTRQSEFLKQFPNAVMSKEAVIGICPTLVDTTYPCRFCTTNKVTNDVNCCNSCKMEYWFEKVE